MQTSDNMSTPYDVHSDDTLAATRGRGNYYFSFATWPIGVGTPRSVRSVHSSTLQDSCIPFHNSPTHPLSLDFTRWPSLGPAQFPGEARLGESEAARFGKTQF